MDKNLAEKQESEADVHIALGSTASLTVGFVSWILRGGSLLASMITTLPLLNRFDPLPIIKTNDTTKVNIKEPDDETNEEPESRVDRMFSKQSSSSNNVDED